MAPIDGEWFVGTSKSSSGIPGWANQGLQKWLNTPVAGNVWGRLESSMSGLDKLPGFIEKKRRLLGEQYDTGLGATTRQAIGDATAAAFGRGINDSTMAGDNMERIARALAQGAQQAHATGNIWAADAETAALNDRVKTNMGMAGLLGDLLGLSRYSSSSSRNPPAWVPAS